MSASPSAARRWALRTLSIILALMSLNCVDRSNHAYRLRVARSFPEAPPLGVDPMLGELLTFHPGWVTRLQSSHDPNGANMDNAVDGGLVEGGWQTLFHAKGEGRITRLWMTADSDTDIPRDYLELWIQLDGVTAYRGVPLDYFLGRGRFHSPLVLGQRASSGGLLSWVPYPFQHEAKVMLRGRAHYYQVSYRQGPGSSQGPTAEQIATFLASEWWKDVPPPARIGRVSRAQPLVIAEGPTLVTNLAMSLDPWMLPQLRLRVGGQGSFPLSFFFGFTTSKTAKEGAHETDEIGWPKYESALAYSDPPTRMLLSRLPVPLGVGERLVLETETLEPIEVKHGTSTTTWGPEHEGVRLITDYREQRGPGTPTTFPVLDETGPLQLISQVEEISGGNNGERGFLEGDEMIRTDGMRYPLHLGTGTEDYFNGGFYFQGVHGNPMSGLTRFKVLDGDNGWSHATFEYAMYRHHVIDPLVGRSGMRFGWESGEDGRYLSASFRTLVLAYGFSHPREIGRLRFVLGKSRGGGEIGFGEPGTFVTSAVDAERAQVPFAFPLRTKGGRPTRLDVPCPPGGLPAGLLLVRDYDASVAGQSASVSLHGAIVEYFFEPFRNTVRRFAQDAVWIGLLPDDCRTGSLRVDVQSSHPAGVWTESAYEAIFYR